ncbi:MAG: amidohydrolase family protein [Candidatus Sphingomonas colombiensis]|nr:amidohydrolase family protein [Sphingomonas sp.]WEK43978.1 MAG: amidohydrolase family protein [Sphingomonas sp.]
MKVNRMIGASLLALAQLAAPTLIAQAHAAAAVSINVSEGTHLAFALSPDAQRIVLDLQGVLYVMPATGGAATPITDALYDGRQPSWSPDGKWIAFQSNRDGHYRIWLIAPDGTQAHPFSTEPYEAREPAWSPDGKWLAFTSNRDGKFDIWARNIADGSVRKLSNGLGGNSRASWSPDGTRIAYASDRMGATGIYVADMQGRETLAAKANVMAFGMNVPIGTPTWTADGKDVLWARIAEGKAVLMKDDKPLIDGEDIHPFRAAWLPSGELLYAANGKLNRRKLDGGGEQIVPFTAAIKVSKPDYAKRHVVLDSRTARPVIGVQRAMLSPDGKQVTFTALGDLWLMPVGGRPRKLTDGGPYVVVDPSWSPKGDKIVYASDREGSLDLWIADLASGRHERLTSAPGAEMRPAWSPDGKSIVYVDASGAYTELVRVIDLVTKQSREIKEGGSSPGYPAFTPDGKSLIVSTLRNASDSQSYVVGGYNELSIVPADGAGKARAVSLVPGKSVGNRSGDGPVLSPDGKLYAYQMDSALYVQPAGPDGSPAGVPRKLSDTIPTGLSWSADSRTLLINTGGHMQLMPVAGGAARKVALPLQWTAARGEGVTTIRAGMLVDGVKDQARRDMDIVIDGSRIRSITPHGTQPVQGRFIDASNLTVMPGLMDMHVHLIKEYGSSFGRLYLAYGITTIRSPGNVPGDVIEEKEAIAAGRRPGPNMFVTGYILDGERTVWEMGTPVASRGEVDRQIGLAKLLDYDMIKSYVHTAEPVRQQIVAAAHAAGIPVSSHEIYPAALFGSDSVEHLDGNGAGRGYSEKASQLNISYEDSVKIIANSGMTVTPTISLFTPTAELVDHDPTIAKARWALQPVWVREGSIMSFANGPGAEVLANNIRQSIAKIFHAGGKIVVGTDSPFTPIGINTHNELVQEVKAGLTPFEALRSATAVPAELVGVNKDLGTVEVGKIADLVFVEGNPLEDIRNASKVRKVMKTGRLYTIEQLLGQSSGTK